MSDSLVTPWTVAHQAFLCMELSRQEYWSGLPFPSPGDLPNPEIEPVFLMSLELAGRFFTTSAIWEALCPRIHSSYGQRNDSTPAVWALTTKLYGPLKLSHSGTRDTGQRAVKECFLWEDELDSRGCLVLDEEKAGERPLLG